MCSLSRLKFLKFLIFFWTIENIAVENITVSYVGKQSF